MKLLHLILATMLILFFCGCSTLEFYNIYNQCQPPCEEGVYVFQCDSGSFKMYLGDRISLRLIGPPLVPFFPTHPGSPKRIYISVYPVYDSLLNLSESPDFALKPRNSDDLIMPEWSDVNRSKHNYSYLFSFYIGRYSPDTLEVVFLKEYLGCKLPPVTFIANKKTEYVPIMFPSH
ncbi:MAG: hypothetical protein IPH11_16300 [Ignavibacteriales bacterium]|nr:hypothetical protein [Ignavibacteriales bacterium]